jgi:hypothetical protein
MRLLRGRRQSDFDYTPFTYATVGKAWLDLADVAEM